MRKVNMELTVYLPGWNLCNLDSTPNSKGLCPFCNKDRHGHFCSMYMERLDKTDTLVYKTSRCVKATAYRTGEATHEPIEDVAVVPPQKLMKMALDEYDKQTKALMKQGYPVAIAQQVAREYVLKNEG